MKPASGKRKNFSILILTEDIIKKYGTKTLSSQPKSRAKKVTLTNTEELF